MDSGLRLSSKSIDDLFKTQIEGISSFDSAPCSTIRPVSTHKERPLVLLALMLGRVLMTGLNFFFDDYKAKHWYWEVIECFRKLVLTGVALFFGEQGSLVQTAAVMWLVLCYIVVLLRVQPYKLPYDNHMALLVNVDMFIILFPDYLGQPRREVGRILVLLPDHLMKNV